MSNNLANNAHEKTLIAVDLDDVIFDCNGTLQVILVKEFRFSGTYSDFIKLNPDMINVAFKFLYGKYHQDSLPVAGALEAILTITTKYRMTVITGRSELVRVQTFEWLERNFPGVFTEVHFTNNFLSTKKERCREKHHVCSSLGVQTIIEDSHDVAVKAASSNMNVLLMDRPWNQDVPKHPNIHRIKRWNQVNGLLSKFTE
jgi:hypothetical protein